MSDHAWPGCLICAKHRGEGPLIGGVMVWEDEHSLVFPRPIGETGTAVLGYLFVESRRHAAVAGMSHAHFHQHVFARHPDTPAEYDWMKGDQWPGAPRGRASAITELCERLRPYLGTVVS